MAVKIILAIMLLAGVKLLYSSINKPAFTPEPPIDKAWWDELSGEWRMILLINQNFQKQGVDLFKLQAEYINRLNAKGEAAYSEMNKSLQDLNEARSFGLGYKDMYARALRTHHLEKNDSIDLVALAGLETLYMVNGPGDLTPLKRLPRLKVLIINSCGVDNNIPVASQVLDLGPLKYLKELKLLHCSSAALQSLTPIKDLVNLEELKCENSSVTDLAPIKKLARLKRLSFGSKVVNGKVVSHLVNLEELYIMGCKQVPDLSGLPKLKKLSISENELAIVNAGYRLGTINFLKDLPALEFLDLGNTSYRGSLDALYGLQHLKAVTLPPVGSPEMQQFRKTNGACIVINSFQFER